MMDVVIVAATRTPIGSFHGALAPLSAVELGTTVIRALLEGRTSNRSTPCRLITLASWEPG